MEETSLQFALRELRRLITDMRTVAILLVLTLVLGLSGPFHTLESMTLVPRMLYWAVTVVLTGTVGVFFGMLSTTVMRRLKAPFPLIVLADGFGAGIPVALTVILISYFPFGDQFESGEFLIIALYCLIISNGLSLIFALFGLFDAEKKADDDSASAKARPRILDRVPLPQRGDLVSLSVSDHYVDVVTTGGRHMLLMRLSDAIAETEGVAGIQIHRSHWVALDQVARVSRTDGKTSIETSAGDRLPVSRGYQAAVRDAGLVT